VRCNEPSIEDAVVMLRGLKDKYEQHHKVFMLDEAVQSAVELATRYISGRFLPDKAVDLLDTTAARVAVGMSTRPGILDDLDRRLNNLDTAIAAVKRDAAGGVATDADALIEMESTRASLVEERERVEQTWKAELEAVKKIHKLRARLPGYKANGDQVDGDGEEAKTEEAEAPVDEAALRKQIDEAMNALKAVQGESPLVHPHVDGAAVASVVSDWTGIPVGRMVKDAITASLDMEGQLRGRVIGQEHALSIISQKLRTAKAGIGNPNQPMGVFLCVGPSGVGKTELATAVSDLLFGGDEFLTTINMSEFMEAHTVSSLKGSPPGYVGYGEGGILTEAVRQHPYSVVLLDEVEKAHPDVLNLFYQVFDKGTLADGEGRVIDFKNTVIFLTSNLGTDVIQGMCESGEAIEMEDLLEGIYPHLRNHFKPALVARMTVIPFMTLEQDVLESIAAMKAKKVGDRLAAAHGMSFHVDDGVYAQMAKLCTQVDIGARQIDHLLDQTVLPQLSRELLTKMAEDKMPSAVMMKTEGDEGFSYVFTD
jgi:type VI secretion system protein VasG